VREPHRLAAALLLLALSPLARADRDEPGEAAAPAVAAPAPRLEATFEAKDLKPGRGPLAAAGQTAIVEYTGWLYDPTQKGGRGRKFDSSIGREPFRFVLGAGRVIRGWELGVTGMRVGGIRRLVIPPQLAYGARGAAGGVIPPFATLLFRIELIGVEPAEPLP
jgi:FKBP-type peptidyl-prolyl cis-trans isomerase FkpA